MIMPSTNTTNLTAPVAYAGATGAFARRTAG